MSSAFIIDSASKSQNLIQINTIIHTEKLLKNMETKLLFLN